MPLADDKSFTQFKMNLQHLSFIFLQLFFLYQLCYAGNKEDLSFSMQKNVESLIGKIISQIQNHYNELKSKSKCIPDSISDDLIETLKKSVDCVHKNEKNYMNGKIRETKRSKNFFHCFSNAKQEVKDKLKSSNLDVNHCPENITEKTYRINVITTYSKTFYINIKNGLKVDDEKVEFLNRSAGDHGLMSTTINMKTTTDDRITETTTADSNADVYEISTTSGVIKEKTPPN